MYFVYALWADGEDAPFYIGKGTGDRPRQHFAEARSWDGGSRFRIMPNGDKYWYNVGKLTKMRQSTTKVVILADGLTEERAYIIESLLIASYGPSFDGGVLTNMTWGGDGVSMTPEIKKKLSEARLGKKHTEEFKNKHREMFSGDKNPFFGKKHTKASISKVSASRKGKCLGDSNPMSRQSTRDKISGSNNVNFGIAPWLQSRANKGLWNRAQELYNSWKVDSCGYVKLAKRNNIEKPHSLITLVENFKSGWVPLEDEEWVRWKT